MNKDQILREIRRTAKANAGKPLGKRQFFAETGVKEGDWRGRYWARWSDAISEAGFAPNVVQQRIDDSVLLGRLALLTRELGRFPVIAELQLKRQKDNTFPHDTVFRRFGGKQQLIDRLLEFIQQDRDFKDLEPLVVSTRGEGPQPVEEPTEVNEELGFVYLLKSGRFWKIGRSNSVGRRERELAIQLPERAQLVHSIRTDDPVGIEEYWHRRFASKRKNGEWFELSASEIAVFRRRKFM